MKMKNIYKKKYFLYSLFTIGGLLLGWILFHHSGRQSENLVRTAQADKAEIWTCAMHPQIRMTEPGKCPICGMDLIPLNQSNVQTDPSEIHMTREAAQLANVLTTVVSRQKPVKEVRLYGKVQADERRLQSQVAQIPGRIEKLMINYTGETVHKGQVLAILYSPELVTAQQELIEAAKSKKEQPEIYEASRERLLQWKLSEEQISQVENSGKVQDNFEVLSTTSGIVTSKNVNNGDFVNRGSILYNLADLSVLWIMFDAYEDDIQFIKNGDKIKYTIQALPGTIFSGKISFIDPVLDPVTRVVRIRVEVDNNSGKLKPEMFATGIISAGLNEYVNPLVIPKTAVLWTGKRSIVYVKQPQYDEPVFRLREIGLGPMLGESYIVTDGLSAREEIVTQGAFSVDAAAQLEGKPSMMNPEGGKTATMPGMDMPGDESKVNNISSNTPAAQNAPQEIIKNSVSMDFTMQLNSVYDKYIVMKNAFVQSDAKKVSNASKDLGKALAGVDMKLLTKDQNIKWMEISAILGKQIDLITSSGDIEEQRASFISFNDQFYKAVKSFGLMGKTAYYQFCPMANDGKGAYWLSETEDIRNPYYGDAMLTCGETKEIIR